MKPRSLRFRMMALFCLVVGGLLLSSYAIIYSIFARELRAQLDRRLDEAATRIVKDLAYNTSDQDVFALDLPDEYLKLEDASGRTLNTSRNWREHPLNIGTLDVSSGKRAFQTVQGPRGTMRMELVPFRLASRPVVFAFASPTREVDTVLARFRIILILLFPVSFVLVGVISAWYVGRSLSPIAGLTNEASRLTQLISQPGRAELKAPRIVAGSQDELGQLASTFNELFLRVVSVLQQLRQFVSDASHELRTPLSVLQGETELLLQERKQPEEYEQALRVIHGELRQLTRIVEALFTLSMADAGQLRVTSAPVYLNEVLEEACAIAVPLARTKGITIEQDLHSEIVVNGDEALLRELFLVFLENAVKYSSAHTYIRVRLRESDGSATAQVADQGAGISPEHLPHIFERFYRATGPDDGDTRGSGLGLAIAQAIVTAHGGTVGCQSVPGRGSTCTVTFPLAQAGAAKPASSELPVPAK